MFKFCPLINFDISKPSWHFYVPACENGFLFNFLLCYHLASCFRRFRCNFLLFFSLENMYEHLIMAPCYLKLHFFRRQLCCFYYSFPLVSFTQYWSYKPILFVANWSKIALYDKISNLLNQRHQKGSFRQFRVDLLAGSRVPLSLLSSLSVVDYRCWTTLMVVLWIQNF